MARNTTDQSRSNITWWAVAALAVVIALVAGLALLGDDVGEEPPAEEQLPEEPVAPGEPPEEEPGIDNETEDNMTDPAAPEDEEAPDGF